MRFAVLGPTTVDDGTGEAAVPSGIPETVLVALLLSSPRAIRLDALIDTVWPERPSMAAVDSLRNHLKATGDILRVCAGLPLALRIVGARLQARRSWPVQTLASRLTDAARLRASIDDRAGQAESLLRLSRALANLGRAPEASAIWNEASAMVDEIGSTRLVELRATLEADAAVTAGPAAD